MRNEMMIETERLLLREYTMDDFDALYEIMSDAETMQHYPAPFDEARTKRWIEWNLENYAWYGFGLYCKYTNEASYKTAEAIGMHFDKEYPDEANKITHVSVLHRAATGKDR